jgi:hypothetical protein
MTTHNRWSCSVPAHPRANFQKPGRHGAAFLVTDVRVTDGGDNWVASLRWVLLFLTPMAGIPLACAAAVLKYRLYEIDRIISRTLAFAWRRQPHLRLRLRRLLDRAVA